MGCLWMHETVGLDGKVVCKGSGNCQDVAAFLAKIPHGSID
jgi:hypothetical protein